MRSISSKSRAIINLGQFFRYLALYDGQVGIIGHIKIGDGVKIAARSGVMKSFPDGVTISGIPSRLHRVSLSKDANTGRVPKLSKRLKELEQEVDKLKNRLNENE